MSAKTHIEWTEATWNPVTGCSKVSQGCKNCYALREWPRMAAPRPQPNVYTGRAFTDVKCHPERLEQPLRWTKPRRIFVNSMSDLFHERVPDSFIDKVFAVMGSTPWHTYQVLTKRPQRMLEWFNTRYEPAPEDVQRATHERQVMECQAVGVTLPPFRLAGGTDRHDEVYQAYEDLSLSKVFNANRFWTAEGRSQFVNAGWPLPNVWLGVSVEDQATANERIPLLRSVPAAVRFVSAEPLLGPVDLQATGDTLCRCDGCMTMAAKHPDSPGLQRIDWVIVGGESGPAARPMQREWARGLRDQCSAAGVPFFFKQWGEWSPNWLNDDAGEPIPGSDRMDRCGKKVGGRQLDGRTHDDYPTARGEA